MQKRRILRTLSLLFALLLLAAPLTACAKQKDPLAVSAFLSLTVNAKREKLHATVSLGQSDVQAHEGERAYIYEILPGESIGDKSFSKREPVAHARISSSMKFKFDLYDGIRTRLYSSFVACFENGKLINSVPKTVDNPDELAPVLTAPLWSDTPKGLTSSDVNTASVLGAQHTMVDVTLTELANPAHQGDNFGYTFFGKRYTLSLTALERLDEEIYYAYHAGMQVSLRIGTHTGDLSTDAARETFLRTAILDFLTERYDCADYGIVTTLFIDANDISPEDTARLAATAYCALRSNVREGRIYVTCPEQALDAAADYCKRLGSTLAKHTSMAWGVALRFDPTQKTPWNTESATTLTPDTLKAFRDTLSRQSNHPLYLAVCDLAYSADDETLQSVAFAYAYAKAHAADADLILYGNMNDEKTGMYREDGTPRPIVDVFRRIETGLDAEQLRACAAVSETVAETVAALRASHRVITGTGNLSEGSGKESVLYDFTKDNTYDFSAVGGSDIPAKDNPACKESAAYDSPVLYTWLNNKNPQTGVRKLLSNGEELKNATSLSFHVLAQYKQTDVQSCLMILHLQGVDENGTPIRFEAAVSAPTRTWQDVNFNISAFTAAVDLSKPVVMTFLVATDDTVAEVTEEDFGLWIKSVSVHRPRADLAVLFTVLAAVLGGAVSFIVIFYLYRRTHGRRQKGVRHVA